MPGASSDTTARATISFPVAFISTPEPPMNTCPGIESNIDVSVVMLEEEVAFEATAELVP